ncbi:peptidyl-tRNA hydrolase protein 1 [Mactra antiquata]
MSKVMNFKRYCVLFNTISSSRSYINTDISLFRHISCLLDRQRTNVAGKSWEIRCSHSGTQNMEQNSKEIYLIAGLGNYDYPGTRHSVGMQLIKRLGEFLDIKFTKNKECLGFIGTKELRHIHIVLLQPKLAMNINGTSVQKTAKTFNVPIRNIYLVHDELGKAVGKTSLKQSGSAGYMGKLSALWNCTWII